MKHRRKATQNETNGNNKNSPYFDIVCEFGSVLFIEIVSHFVISNEIFHFKLKYPYEETFIHFIAYFSFNSTGVGLAVCVYHFFRLLLFFFIFNRSMSIIINFISFKNVNEKLMDYFVYFTTSASFAGELY